MTEAVLVLNVGSSSAKFSLHARDGEAFWRGQISGIGTPLSCFESDHGQTRHDIPDPESAIALLWRHLDQHWPDLRLLAAVLGGLDGLVFTAGIGEHDAALRARIVDASAWLGLRLDAAANATHGPRISRPDSAPSAWVIPTDEATVIARHTLTLIDSPASEEYAP